MVAGDVTLGLSEISAEPSTRDGTPKNIDPSTGGTRASDGLRVGNSKMLDAAWRAGVLTAVSVPSGEGLVRGTSVGFLVGAKSMYFHHFYAFLTHPSYVFVQNNIMKFFITPIFIFFFCRLQNRNTKPNLRNPHHNRKRSQRRPNGCQFGFWTDWVVA